MRVFKITPKSPAELISRDAVVDCLYARERVNRAILEHGAASDPALAAGAAYKASSVDHQGIESSRGDGRPQAQGAVRGAARGRRRGYQTEPAPMVRTEAEVLADAVADGRRLNLMGSDLDCYVHLVTRPDSQLARVLQQTA